MQEYAEAPETLEILAIEKDAEHRGMVRLTLSHGESCVIDQSLAKQHGLTEHLLITADEVQALQEKTWFSRACRYADNLLQQHDYSFKSLFLKLAGRYDTAVCYRVMQKLVAENAVNDHRLAKNLYYHYVEVKHLGPDALEQQLHRRNLPEAIMKPMMEQYRADESLQKFHLNGLIEEKYKARHAAAMADPVKQNSFRQFLRSKGYSMGIIHAVLKEWFEEVDD